MKELSIPLAVSATLLLVAAFFGGAPAYYQVLRIGVFMTCVFAAYLLRGRMMSGWFWGMVFLAVIYNPFQPFHFSSRVWTILHTAAGAFLLIALKAAK